MASQDILSLSLSPSLPLCLFSSPSQSLDSPFPQWWAFLLQWALAIFISAQMPTSHSIIT